MNLTIEQKAAVDQAGNVCLVSCPGSGKTRTIAAKLVSCINDVRNSTRKVACITHTNAAADEIEFRMCQLLFADEDTYYEVCTIHAFVLQNILKPFHRLLPEFIDGFEILTSDSETYRNKVVELIEVYGLAERLADAFEQFDRTVNIGIRPVNGIPDQVQHDWFAWLDENSYVTLNDMVFHAGRLLLEQGHVLSALASRFAWVLVDEFQDTTASQILILKKLHDIGRTTFFCVGDPNQSIYRFAGARPELLLEFATYVGANTQHRLSGNFRSSTNVVNCAERLCPTTPAMMAVGNYAPFHAAPEHVHSLSPSDAILNTFLPYLEAHGIEFGDTAILAPWWFSLYHLGRELRENNIPVIGPGARPYKRSNLVTQVIEPLCAYLESPEPEISLAIQKALFIVLTNLTDSPAYGIYGYQGRVVVCKMQLAAKEAREQYPLAIDWLNNTMEEFLSILAEANFIVESDYNLFRDGIRSMISDIVKTIGTGQPLHIEDLGIFARPRNCIQLLTVHKSKGREFEAVAIIDVHERKFPHFAINQIPDLEERQALLAESRRVMYVATTRAKRVLMLFTDSSNHRNSPSRYLRDMQLIQ